MSVQDAKIKAEELCRKYNPQGLSPFPYEQILKDHDDLRIFYSESLSETMSGVTTYLKETSRFIILINQHKPETRQNFTIAHELGHYFLHKDYLKNDDEVFTDDEGTLENTSMFRLDVAKYSLLETEANNFAATLLMPESQVKSVWDQLKDIAECARVFSVSISAMSIRLEKLGLIE